MTLLYRRLMGDGEDRHVIASTVAAVHLYTMGVVSRDDLRARVTADERSELGDLLDALDALPSADARDRALSAWDRLVRGAEHGRHAENPVIPDAETLRTLMRAAVGL